MQLICTNYKNEIKCNWTTTDIYIVWYLIWMPSATIPQELSDDVMINRVYNTIHFYNERRIIQTYFLEVLIIVV